MTVRSLPSVDRLLNTQSALRLIQQYGRPMTVQALRHELDQARRALRSGAPQPDEHGLLRQAGLTLADWFAPTLVPVINATGVIIHTNLGRAPLSSAARQAMLAVAAGYSTLEYDLQAGKRGQREIHAEAWLTRLTGAEAALVTNNNAAAVLLALSGLARRKEVLISRSQLIEIGGGFRIPEVLKQSGAKLVEVGTTNRTHLSDYHAAMSPRTALLMRAHHSNFRIIGFTSEPSLADLAGLCRAAEFPLLDDLGSGALLDTAEFGLAHEPTVQESLRSGADLVAFSGDKLLGGPQAGLLVGRKTLIDRLRSHPLARAIRPDKLCLAGLAATLEHYLRDEATRHIPVWQMIAASPETLRDRAEAWRQELGAGELRPGQSAVGGGSLPEETLPTWTLCLAVSHPDKAASFLRQHQPAIIARIEAGALMIDPRTVLPGQEGDLLAGLGNGLQGGEIKLLRA
jgi:L-seryl-tRNA(Ser) seleniumtransferase